MYTHSYLVMLQVGNTVCSFKNLLISGIKINQELGRKREFLFIEKLMNLSREYLC